MKKFVSIIFVSLMAACLFSCASCTKPQNVDPKESGPPVVDASPPVDKSMMVSQDNVLFVLPSTDWQKQDEAPANSLLYLNTELHNVVLFVKEPFVGNTANYSLLSIRGMKEGGAILVSSSQATINGNNFMLIEFSRNNATTKIYSWIIVKNNVAYSFVCGGYDATNSVQRNLCDGIVNTLKID